MDEYGFDVDFYLAEDCRLTLLHAIARDNHPNLWQPNEQEGIKKLVQASNRILMKDKDGKTVLESMQEKVPSEEC